MIPKILIATPTSRHKDYCFKEWSKFICSLTYTNIEIIIVDNSKDSLYHCQIKQRFRLLRPDLRVNVVWHPIKKGQSLRECMTECNNITRDYFLKGGFDWYFSVESDIFTVPDIIECLLLHDKLVCGIPYFFSQGVHSILLNMTIGDIGINVIMKPMHLDEAFEFCDGTLKQANACGIGCMLIHKSVIAKIPFRIDLNDPSNGHADTFFHEDLRKNGIPVFLDTSIIATHKNVDWRTIKEKI